jgi:hypothetical protein
VINKPMYQMYRVRDSAPTTVPVNMYVELSFDMMNPACIRLRFNFQPSQHQVFPGLVASVSVLCAHCLGMMYIYYNGLLYIIMVYIICNMVY